MKKYLIIAVAALAASVACTKTTLDPAAGTHKIAFEVASYVTQTKGDINTTFPGTGGSLWNEGFGSEGRPVFHTYAYFYPAGTGVASVQNFLTDVIVLPFSNATTTAGSSDETTLWQPVMGLTNYTPIDYYWPKTGHVDFFSFASVKEATINGKVTLADGSNTHSKVINFGTAGAPVIIAPDDNILLADACYNATGTNAKSDVNTETVTGETTYGVPTLFRHILTKVQIDLKLKTESTRGYTNYQVDLLEAKITDGAGEPTSGIVNNGYLSIDNPGAGSETNLATQDWNTSGTVGWADATSSTKEAVINLLTGNNVLSLAYNQTQSSETHTLLTARQFRPQTLSSDPKIYLKYKIRAIHSAAGSAYSEEVIEVTSSSLSTKTPNEGKWRMNDFITYHVFIDPVTTTVTFDPAVVDWTAQNGTDINL